MLKIISVGLSILLLNQVLYAKDTYLDTKETNFVAIKSHDREADAWAVCASAYKIMGSIIRSEAPQRADQMKNYGNGAMFAVVMVHVTNGIDDAITPQKFNALWNFSKTLGTSMPDVARTVILADAEEKIEDNNSEAFRQKLTNTIEICLENTESQQMYIDTWRALAKSGLLTHPNL